MQLKSVWAIEMIGFDRQRTGLWSVLLAALLFGISTPLSKGLLGEIPPQILAGLLYLGSGVGLTVLTWLLRRGAISREAPLTHIDVPWLSGAIIFGGILAPVLLLTGLQQTPASNASLLLNLEAVFTVIFAWIVFHENVDRKFALGMGAVLFGSVFVSWQGVVLGGGLVGPLAIAMACLCWGVDNNLTQKVSAGDPVQISAIKGLVAGSVNLLLGMWLLHSLPALAWVPAALVVGFFSYGLSIALFVLALRDLGTARTGAYFSTAPFIGAIFSVIILREVVTSSLVAAAIAMTIGVWLLLNEKHSHNHIHNPLAHSHPHIHDEHHQHRHGRHDPPGEPHVHLHEHVLLIHSHPHRPDIHLRHSHDQETDNQESAASPS
jgi:drug/metabolite transporter (DMT)-like permease